MAKKTPELAKLRLDDNALFDRAARYEQAKRIQGRVERIAKEVQGQICDELQLRGVGSVDDGRETTITLVQTVTYDADGLAGEVTPAVRRDLFEESHDLNALPEDVRATILESLTPAQRRGIRSLAIKNVKALQEAIGKRITVAKARKHRKLGSPYIRISHGAKQAKR
ncbi:hypothetical protein [Longimicrobium sp.]|uniref:hypothetical protein n=1 Tax=Longimicrobium sp. TaxID=2029185 RepID=UPI002EDAE2C7